MDIEINSKLTRKAKKRAEKSTWKNPRNSSPQTELEKNIIANLWKTKKTAAFFNVMTGLPIDELESVARMCLMKSAQTYDQDKPANFSTWVNRCLHLHMLNYLRDKSRMLKMPRRYPEIYLKIRKARKKNPDITIKQLSEQLNISINDITEVSECFNSKILDIFYFEEEVLGGGSGEINDDLLDYSFSLDRGELNNPSYYQMTGLLNLEKEEIELLESVIVRGLCDNTLRKKYKKDIQLLLDKVEDLIDTIYFQL